MWVYFFSYLNRPLVNQSGKDPLATILDIIIYIRVIHTIDIDMIDNFLVFSSLMVIIPVTKEIPANI